jgi:hypothetical protein
MKVNYEYAFDTAFDEKTLATERESVIRTLKNLIDFTTRSIELFDREFFS